MAKAFDDLQLRNAEKIGAILKEHRERQDKSQRDVALVLGYRNVNFISMIESGRSNPPLSRLADICRAYDLPVDFVPVMLKALFPDTWEAIKSILAISKDLFVNRTPAQIEKELDHMMAKMLKEYKVS